MNILDAVLQQDGADIEASANQLLSAFQVLRRKSRLDHYGASVAAIKLLGVAVPSVVVDMLSTGLMWSQMVFALLGFLIRPRSIGLSSTMMLRAAASSTNEGIFCTILGL